MWPKQESQEEEDEGDGPEGGSADELSKTGGV